MSTSDIKWICSEGLHAERLPGNPIIRPHMDERMGANVNGPCLIQVPDWVDDALGRYYLYFADHQGAYIRLAYADDLEGPYWVHTPGALDLEDSHFHHHVASPDVHVDHERRTIRMYVHGRLGTGVQGTRVALSHDGLSFHIEPEVLGEPYMRAFIWREKWYGLAMPGIFYRSATGLDGFERGPTLFGPSMRHAAVVCVGDTLLVLYSNAGDCPESILAARIGLTRDWLAWKPTTPAIVLTPSEEYEGGALPLRPSRRGRVHEPVRELRDPFVYVEGSRAWLLYAVAGERGIAIAQLFPTDR
jgi:hypothetical protein